MKGLERYFLRQFAWYFIVFTIGLTVFFSAIHFLDDVDGLLPHDPPLSKLLVYFILILPKYFLYLLPMSTLICSILTFALASKRKEVIAYKASGGDIRRLLIPFVLTGAFISLVNFGFNEYVAPASTMKLKDLEYSIQEKKERLRLRQGNIWMRGERGLIVHAGAYIPSEKSLRNVVIFSLKESRAGHVISSDKAEWEDAGWVLKEATKYDFINRKVMTVDDIHVGGLSDPEVIAKEISTPDEMGIAELLQYRKKLDIAGYRSVKLDVDIFARMTYPLACLFMMIIGCSIALMSNLHSGVLGVAIGVAVSLVYGFFHTFMISLGYAGVMMPIISVSVAPFIFTIVSVVLLTRIPR